MKVTLNLNNNRAIKFGDGECNNHKSTFNKGEMTENSHKLTIAEIKRQKLMAYAYQLRREENIPTPPKTSKVPKTSFIGSLMIKLFRIK